MPAGKIWLPAIIIICIAVIGFGWKIPSSKRHTPAFRDLNKNGKLDVYEDIKQPVDARISDLLKQMTLEEKAGMMFINGARINDDGSIEDKPGKGMFAFAPNALMLVKEKR